MLWIVLSGRKENEYAELEREPVNPITDTPKRAIERLVDRCGFFLEGDVIRVTKDGPP